ncbi:MAG TPA: hypothetical protein VNV15_06355 [Opitutaceae bacterium]|nr:hypothetical protein [Opitutaceae bacterium]
MPAEAVKPETLFVNVLRSMCEKMLLNKKRYPHRAALAKALGIDPPWLSRLLGNLMPVGSRTVARICSRVGRNEAAALLQAYLLDEAASVTRISKEFGKPLGKDTLVTISKVQQ